MENTELKSLQEIAKEAFEWSQRNFGKPSVLDNILGMIEEVGELSHAVLKERQKIRHTDYVAAKKDAIADLTIYTLNYLSALKVDTIPHPISIENIHVYIPSVNTCEWIVSKLNKHIPFDDSRKEIHSAFNVLALCSMFCEVEGWDYLEVVNSVWNEVSKRDWIKYPLNGIDDKLTVTIKGVEFKRYSSEGYVVGNAWGGGVMGYPARNYSSLTKEELISEINKDFESGALDSGFGFESLVAAKIGITEYRTIDSKEGSFTSLNQEFIYLGDSREEIVDFLDDNY